MRSFYIFYFLLTVMIVFTAEGTIRRVPQDYAKIQLAVDAAADRDTVLVSEGQYLENVRVNGKKILIASLYIIDGLESHITNTVINGSSPTHPDVASAVYFTGNTDTLSGIIGFTITGGTGNVRWVTLDGVYGRSGGGIDVLEVAGLRIAHNIIRGNTLSIRNNVINMWGGGISITCSDMIRVPLPSYVIVEYNRIENNNVLSSRGDGGGVAFWTNGRVVKNYIINNYAQNANGGINCGDGISALFADNYLRLNRANIGGGTGAYIYKTKIPAITFVNNIFYENSAITNGAQCDLHGGTFHFINNTFYKGSTTIAGGAFHIERGTGYHTIARFLNNIFWDLTSQEISLTSAPSIYAAYNVIKGGYEGTGNISTDPSFAQGDTLCRLTPGSPAIGVGQMNYSMGGAQLSAPVNDFFGLARPAPSFTNPEPGAAEHPLGAPSTATIIRVPQDYPKIQQAINAAGGGNIVLVSEGTYVENLKITKKITLASQYLIDGDTSHISKTIIDGSMPLHPDSGSVIFIGTGTDSTLVITGFTITKGTGLRIIYSGVYVYIGGGINIVAGGATIRNNRIMRNKLTGTTVRPWAWGAGVSIGTVLGALSYWVIEDNLFSENEVSARASEGGGVVASGYGRIQRNRFINNKTIAAPITGPGNNYSAGGGIAVGGDPSIGDTRMTISENYFYQNSASWGSAILGARWDATNLPVFNFINNIIVKNVSAAPPSGSPQVWGTIHLHQTDSYFINNTIADNTGQYGMYVEQTPHTVRMLNNILWNPSASFQIRFANASTVNLLASYNIIKDIYPGTGNLNLDPQFAAADNYYRVMSGSPAIGMGSIQVTVGGSTLSAPGYDFFGNPRPNPLGANPDIGAFEHSRATPLPVELTSFTAEATGSTVLIKWATATEINNRGFEIQRKAEGDYFTVGYVGGHGTATIPYNYAYSDKDVPSGSYSYRLKQIDYNGAFEYSPEIEVTVGAETFVLQENYPNPFNPSTIISYQIPIKSKVQLKVLDILGCEVATLVNAEQEAGSYKVEFSAARNSIPPLSSGVYFYQLRADPSASSGTVVITRKMLLMK